MIINTPVREKKNRKPVYLLTLQLIIYNFVYYDGVIYRYISTIINLILL